METGLISAETGKGDQGLTRESKERTQVMSLEVPEERTPGRVRSCRRRGLERLQEDGATLPTADGEPWIEISGEHEEERTLGTAGLRLPLMSKSQASTRQAIVEKGDHGRWSRGLAELALELEKRDQDRIYLSVSRKNQVVFGKNHSVYRDFLVSNFKNCLKHNTKKNLDMF
jgi:hypothetical protein